MGIKTIALDEGTYQLLRRQKRKGETFNELVRRLLRRKRPLHEFAGAWKDIPEEEFQEILEAIRRGRELDEERFARLMERWG
ncbi:MAG TPA: antitoxin VapB family protein [Thermoplasmata archaeon]|nr:antitoxin VapB family protein [Thermoplasmata archaeon]